MRIYAIGDSHIRPRGVDVQLSDATQHAAFMADASEFSARAWED